MIPGFERRDAFAHLDHHAGTFMAENGGKGTFRIVARKGEGVGVTDPGGLELHQHLASPRAVEFNGFNRQRGTGLEGHSGAGFHDDVSFVRCWCGSFTALQSEALAPGITLVCPRSQFIYL